jgi:hypothetical protein
MPLRNKKRPPKGGFSARSDNERLRDRDCSATPVALEADRADGENDSKRKIAQASISATNISRR